MAVIFNKTDTWLDSSCIINPITAPEQNTNNQTTRTNNRTANQLTARTKRIFLNAKKDLAIGTAFQIALLVPICIINGPRTIIPSMVLAPITYMINKKLQMHRSNKLIKRNQAPNHLNLRSIQNVINTQ